MFFLFQLVHHRYGKVFDRYVAVSVGIHHQVVFSDAEPCGALAGCHVGGGGEEYPVDVFFHAERVQLEFA